MKTFTAALAVLLVAALCYQLSSAQPSVDPSLCCRNFTTRSLPLRLVDSYWYTSCYPPAVIFFTINKNLVCANPEDKWVQDRINQVKKRKLHG